MKEHREVRTALENARKNHCCAFGRNAAMRRALNRRFKAGELISPFRNTFVEREIWNQLNGCERTCYAARTLSQLHSHWVFAGLTAADFHGLSHSWRLHNGNVYIADSKRSGFISRQRIERIYESSIRATVIDRVNVTDIESTVIACGLRFPFNHALSIIDAALRNGMSIKTLRERCEALSIADRERLNRLMRYASGKSENGGESWVRATLITMGFAPPELQVEFANPDHPDQRYRVDFLWRLYDGRLIVLEFDGMRKYSDSDMTHGRSVQQVVEHQIERDRALRQAGVTTILHCYYAEVNDQAVLFSKLREAGVPWVGSPFD